MHRPVFSLPWCLRTTITLHTTLHANARVLVPAPLRFVSSDPRLPLLATHAGSLEISQVSRTRTLFLLAQAMSFSTRSSIASTSPLRRLDNEATHMSRVLIS